jgi:hypothetical protein
MVAGHVSGDSPARPTRWRAAAAMTVTTPWHRLLGMVLTTGVPEWHNG